MIRKTIVVVEDDPLLRMNAALMLQEAGLDVVEFPDADHALAFMRRQADRVVGVFTDVQVPGQADGLELAEFVSGHWSHITVLVTSGRLQPLRNLPARVSFVRKPWLPLQVLNVMQQAVASA